jgi:hypothetical protein
VKLEIAIRPLLAGCRHLPFGFRSTVLRTPLGSTVGFGLTLRSFAACTKVNDVAHAQSRIFTAWVVASAVHIDGKCADTKASGRRLFHP